VSVSEADSPPASETVTESLPRLPASRVTVCVSVTSPVFSMVVSTESVSPPTTGELLPAMVTTNCTGACTVTPVLSVLSSLVTVAV
jgi:hypothetical protein